MPNGDDKNAVRMFITIAGYHAKFGSWPDRILVMHGFWEHTEPYVPGPWLAALRERASIEIVERDPYSESFFEACGKEGCIEYGEALHMPGRDQDSVQEWLGPRDATGTTH